MKSRVFSPARRTYPEYLGRVLMIAVSLGMAAIVFTTRAAAQDRTTTAAADPIPAAPDSQPKTSVSSTHVEEEISAPEPVRERATLENPLKVPFLSLEARQDSSQSSSQSGPAATTPQKSTASKTKPPHHALGITLAVLGTTTFVAGAVLLAGEQSIGFCNGASKGCHEARDTGIALIPIGAGVAVTGFYLQFHR